MKIDHKILLSALENCSLGNNGLVKVTPGKISSVGPSMSVSVAIQGAGEEVFVLPMARLLSVLKGSATGMVDISINKGSAVIKVGRSVIRLPLSEESAVPETESLQSWSDLPRDVVTAAMAVVSIIPRRDNLQGNFFSEGASIRPLGNGMVVCGHDSSAMAFCVMSKVDQLIGNTIPVRLVRAMGGLTGNLEVAIGDNSISVRGGGVTFTHRKLSRKQVEVEKIVPKLMGDLPFSEVEVRSFGAAIRAASQFSKERDFAPFVVKSDVGCLSVSSEDVADGGVDSEVDCPQVAPGMVFKVNSKYVLDFLGSVESESIKLAKSDHVILKGSTKGLEVVCSIATMRI